MKTLILSLALLATVFAPGAVLSEQQPGVEINENAWQGKLVDWTCKQAHVDEACPVGPSSKEFALSIDGGILLYFDERGNELTLKILREAHKGGNAAAIVVGEREGRLLKVESVHLGPADLS